MRGLEILNFNPAKESRDRSREAYEALLTNLLIRKYFGVTNLMQEIPYGRIFVKRGGTLKLIPHTRGVETA